MKLKFSGALLWVLLSTPFLQSCLKDTTRHTYTIFTPVYKTKAEVRAEIKSAPARPIEQAGKLFAIGNYVFLNEVDKGIHVIDNSNPAAPVNKYFIAIPGNIDMAVRGNILYADLYADMVTLDISNPNNVQLKKVSPNVFPFRQYSNGFRPDTSMVIIGWNRKDTTVVSDFVPNSGNVWFSITALSSGGQGAQSAAGGAPGVGGSMARFCLLNDFMYTVTDRALNVFNISNAVDPVYTNKVNIGWNIETIYPFKSNLFIGSQNGMFIYNTVNPQQPAYVSSFAHANACDPVIADDTHAYITLRSGTACENFTNQLDVVDITSLSQPKFVRTYPLTNPHGLSKKGDYVYICDGKDGLKVFDAKVPSNLKQIQHVKGLQTYDAIALQNVLLVVTNNGLYQYTYQADGKVQLLSKIVYK